MYAVKKRPTWMARSFCISYFHRMSGFASFAKVSNGLEALVHFFCQVVEPADKDLISFLSLPILETLQRAIALAMALNTIL